MSIKKYKYYFKKPRSEIVKDVLKTMLVVGVVCIAAQSPYFTRNLIKGFRKWKKYPRQKIYDTFYYLKKHGYLRLEIKNCQIYIYLTEEGKRKAGWLQIDNLRIKKPMKWDKKWRIIIFDIPNIKNLYREAFRGKLKELGFCQLQKSVWIHPFDCEAEIELLRNFFGLNLKELRLIVAEKIGEETELKNYFHLQ